MSMKTTHLGKRPEEADYQPGDSPFVTLRDAIGEGQVVKVIAASWTSSASPRAVNDRTAKKLCDKLIDANGEWYRPGQWAATHEAAKAIGYKTVLITIEEEPLIPVRSVRNAKPSLVESVIWIRVEDETPDEGVVVLLFHPDASEPVWPGVFEGCTADGYAFSHADGSMINGPVLAWAEVPGGPRL